MTADPLPPAAQAPAGVTVKPIVWKSLADGEASANTNVGRYLIYRQKGSHRLWNWYRSETWMGAHESVDAVKAAAQADYEARILACLDLASLPLDAGLPIDATGTARLWPDGGLGCLDCGRRYGDEHGFPDLIVPHDAWARIIPTGHEGGLLCPSCLCARAQAAGVECRAVFRSGPFVDPASPAPPSVEEAALALLEADLDEDALHEAYVAFWENVDDRGMECMRAGVRAFLAALVSQPQGEPHAE